MQFSDFVILSDNFGLVVLEGTASAVPEPSSILLAAIAVLFGLRLLRQG